MSTQKKIFAVLVVLAVAGFALGRLHFGNGRDTDTYRFVEIERGDVEKVVTSTGTLHALTTVQVGTQVSGKVAEIYVDFNDQVKKGQLVARIDPTLLEQEVRAALAIRERRAAEVAQMRADFERRKRLYDEQILAKSEFDLAATNLEVAEADVSAAAVSLDRAQQNLAYTNIYAPIDGVVVERNVDAGQTVAASLSAPQLFLIAEDLAKMEIRVAVDESDIGQITAGRPARFTVQAYPDDIFTGTVRQVRLQSTTAENVVTYTVVVDVANDQGKLLPGMTATVDFLIEQASDVLRVANAALRFRPQGDTARDTTGATPARRERPAAASGERRRRGGERRGGEDRSSSDGTLWTVGGKGETVPVRVQTGLSDGQYTEIRGEGLEEGMRVIAAELPRENGGAATNPFQSQQPQQFRGPRPGGF